MVPADAGTFHSLEKQRGLNNIGEKRIVEERDGGGYNRLKITMK